MLSYPISQVIRSDLWASDEDMGIIMANTVTNDVGVEEECRVGFSSVQSLSHVRLCDPMNCSTPGLPVHHQFPEFT